MALADFHSKLDERCRLPPSSDLPATVWKWALPFAKIKKLIFVLKKVLIILNPKKFLFPILIEVQIVH